MVYGTPFHATAGYNDWEDEIADSVGATKIGAREFIEVEGVVFDLKHKVGKSSIPHGQGTLLAKQKLWNTVWAEIDMQPNAQVVLRGHIHDYCGIFRQNWLAMSCPALEWSTKYGTRMTDGIVNVGLILFKVENGKYEWEHYGCDLGILKTKVIKV